MNGRPMRQFLAGRSANMAAQMPVKIASIRRLKSSARVYVETNHCFIKGFGWLIPEFIPQDKIAVVVLKRDRKKIVDSIARILCTPLTEYGRRWIMTPETANPLIPVPRGYLRPQLKYHLLYFLRNTLFRQKVIRLLTLGRSGCPSFIETYEKDMLDWYVRETWARSESYQNTFTEMRFIECTVDELNTISGVERLFEELQLSCNTDAIAHHLNVRTNLKR